MTVTTTTFETRGHPSMSDTYYLVATDSAGNGLFAWRNWRVGGRHYRMRSQDGSMRDWETFDKQGRTRPKPPTRGRWSWDQEMKAAFG